MSLKIEVSFKSPLIIQHAEPKGYTLFARLGPFKEQELKPAMNPAVTITDTQKFSVGPFEAVDAKGAVIGPATGVTPATGDTNILTAADNGDGTLEFVGGLPGQTQAVCTDPNGKTLVIDTTVIAGAEAGLTASIGAPTDQ